jgi:branched-chain amino acid transport system permease protein
LSIKMALVSILGGVGTLFGPVLGSVVLTVIEELSRATFGGSGRGTDTVIYAALIVVVAVFYPSGIVGWFRERAARRQARRDGASAEQARAAAQDASALAAPPHETTGASL